MTARSSILRMDPDAFPVAIPHVSWTENTFFFGNRPVQPAEADTWALLKECDGSRRLHELMAERHASADELAVIAPWLVWLDAPPSPGVAAAPPFTRMILTAQPEDAWIGMGGRLLKESAEHSTLVVTCFGLLGQCLDPDAFPTLDQISAISRDECVLAARATGVSHDTWDLPSRGPWQSAQSLAANAEWKKSLLQDIILDALARVRPVEIFTPLAIHPHSDAGLLMEVLLAMYVDGSLENETQLHVYEAPDGRMAPRTVDEFLARFERSYIGLRDYFCAITECHERKRSLLEVFRSRVAWPAREAAAETSARNALLAQFGVGARAERFWQVGMAGRA
jgi:LmbE family N-acetylglucosaminyl deacetylase